MGSAASAVASFARHCPRNARAYLPAQTSGTTPLCGSRPARQRASELCVLSQCASGLKDCWRLGRGSWERDAPRITISLGLRCSRRAPPWLPQAKPQASCKGSCEYLGGALYDGACSLALAECEFD